MNNHEWNPITTAPAGEPILVTDGKNVWFGRLGRFGFSGIDLQDASLVSIYEPILTGWLPAPKTMWEPQKTAEEIFQELGYEKVPAPYHQIVFENKTEKTKIVYFQGCGYFECFYDGEIICMSSAEILACAQLIREMEAEEND